MACVCGTPGVDCLIHPWSLQWRRTTNRLLKIGVRAVIRADLHKDGFLSLVVHVQEDDAWLLPRRTTAWKHHISIGMSWDMHPDLVRAIIHKWRFRKMHLRLTVENSIGCIQNSELFMCPLLMRAKLKSRYWNRCFHISF